MVLSGYDKTNARKVDHFFGYVLRDQYDHDLNGGDDDDPDAAKCARTISQAHPVTRPTVGDAAQLKNSNQAQDGAIRRSKSASSLQFERLKEVSFPCAIMALPHILSLIDTLLMSSEEAAIEAARTGQSKWLNGSYTNSKSVT
ncbi:hypothetical protein PC114_g12712 [Phytophthora cactorum]|uniref:Uncharacterized protein n=1 Tax=Phytophthora cactorum TaxID=29920 RepID=A0A8T1DMP5_9STRA|nr:hypothetical protein PC114_g12712 [Phytophthora cactorum]KAG2941650.1 hypothetical protein PC117_g10140 [Phytophthora cactorum]KAG3028472.1 hypothetical protein PC120_g4854 [Phytophthora cactorum]KAG3083456.1 hypothetical protein PC121_g5720 [Phytophthora cactorum]KAG3198755.1 hypothetical protein PC128_g5797 [Phytophthora cactorum]